MLELKLKICYIHICIYKYYQPTPQVKIHAINTVGYEYFNIVGYEHFNIVGYEHFGIKHNFHYKKLPGRYIQVAP